MASSAPRTDVYGEGETMIAPSMRQMIRRGRAPAAAASWRLCQSTFRMSRVHRTPADIERRSENAERPWSKAAWVELVAYDATQLDTEGVRAEGAPTLG